MRTTSTHLTSVSRAALRTGNVPSHRSPDGPVQGVDFVHAQLDPARDARGRMMHPEPCSTVKTYQPGEVSRFAPKLRKPAQGWDFDGALAAREAEVARSKRKPVSVMFNACRYERSHAKAPRGRGLWLFEDSAGEVVFQHNGTLTEAKTAARTWAREHYTGRPSILLYVCP